MAARPRQNLFVVEIDSIVVGAGGWSYRQTIAGAHGPNAPAGAQLDPINDARVRVFYVDPAFARRGVGSLLLGLSETAAGDAGFSKVELTSTIPAVPFYTACGYRAVRPFEMRLPSGATLRLELMEKRLKPSDRHRPR